MEWVDAEVKCVKREKRVKSGSDEGLKEKKSGGQKRWNIWKEVEKAPGNRLALAG